MKTHQKRKKHRKNSIKTEKKQVSEAQKAGRAFAVFFKRRFGIIAAVVCVIILIAGINLGINAMAEKETKETKETAKLPDNPADTQNPPEETREPVADFVDLTLLSGTMVYAEVYNIMVYPEDYLGKTIKMSGLYYSSYFEETSRYCHFVLIEDALACCRQGLEFIVSGDIAYPKDQDRIEVTGVFASYVELGETNYRLEVSDISIIN
jgi:hypothetical protein